MVTTVEADARGFQKRCGGRVRYEPITQPLSYKVEGEAGLEKLAGLSGTLPFHLTEVIDGDHFDAFVVGDRVLLAAADGAPAAGLAHVVADDARGRRGARARVLPARPGPVAGPGVVLPLGPPPPSPLRLANDFRNLVIDSLADLLDRPVAGTGGVRP